MDDLEDYKAIVAKRFERDCNRVIDLINRHVLETTNPAGKGNDEAEVFFNKMKADYYRYIIDVAQESSLIAAKEFALKFYQKACSYNIPACTPTKLGLILNYSALQKDVFFNEREAMKMTEKVLGDAMDKIDELPEDEFKDAKNIIDVLKDNLDMYKQNLEAGGSKKGSSMNVDDMEDD